MRYRILVGLLLLALITYLDRVAISIASVRMQQELHLNPADWGIVLGAFSLAYCLFEIPTGAMGDRLGGRRILTRIVLWWSAFTALTGAVRDIGFISAFWVLVIVRFLFGVGEAGGFPNISAVVSRWFPARERARTIGLSWSASRIGGALSPILIVPLQVHFGWRAAFFVLAAVGLLWAAGWYAFYRDHPSEMKGIRPEEIEEIGETPTISRQHKLPWKIVLKNPNFLLILLMYFSYCWGSYFFISWMPTYLQKGRNFSEAQMAIWATFPFILSASANFFGGWLSDRLVPKIGLRNARRVVGAGGLALGGIFLGSMAACPNASIAAVLLALSYGCMDAMMPVSWALCLDVGGNYSGAVSASMNTAGQIGSFISTIAFGFAVQKLQEHHFSSFDSYNLPLFPLAAMLIVSSFVFLKIDAGRHLVPA